MGKTPKPLNILVVNLPHWEELDALAEQGHNISYAQAAWDIILGPTCWRMDEQHRKYLDLAISEARRRRYPTKDKEAS